MRQARSPPPTSVSRSFPASKRGPSAAGVDPQAVERCYRGRDPMLPSAFRKRACPTPRNAGWRLPRGTARSPTTCPTTPFVELPDGGAVRLLDQAPGAFPTRSRILVLRPRRSPWAISEDAAGVGRGESPIDPPARAVGGPVPQMRAVLE